MAGRDEGCLARLHTWFCNVGCGEREGVTSLWNCRSLFSPNGLESSSSCLQVQGVVQSQWRLPTVAEMGSAGEKGMEVTVWGLGSTAPPAPGIPQHIAFGGGRELLQRRHGEIRLQVLRRREEVPRRCASLPQVVFQDPAYVL